MDSSQVEGFAEEIGAVTKMLSPLAADYMENLENMAKALAEAMQ
jgi:zinc transport system substrate-binding protein